MDTRSRDRMLPSDWLQVTVCGGYDNYYNLRECHVLDLVQGSWRPAPSLTQARWVQESRSMVPGHRLLYKASKDPSVFTEKAHASALC